jgi:hypothetical protein
MDYKTKRLHPYSLIYMQKIRRLKPYCKLAASQIKRRSLRSTGRLVSTCWVRRLKEYAYLAASWTRTWRVRSASHLESTFRLVMPYLTHKYWLECLTDTIYKITVRSWPEPLYASSHKPNYQKTENKSTQLEKLAYFSCDFFLGNFVYEFYSITFHTMHCDV